MSIPMPSISFAGSKKLTAGIALFVSFAGFVLFTNVIAPATAFAVTDPTACLSGEIAVVSLNPTVMMQGKTFCLDITATRPLDANKKCPVGFKLTKDKQSCVNDQFTQMQADGICSLGFDKAYLQSDQTKTPTHCINVATLYDKLRERIGQASEEAKTPQQQQELQSSLEKAGAQQQQQRDQILNQWEQDRQKIVNESKGCGVNVFCILERIFFMLANIGLLFFIGVPILYFTILMYVAALGSGLLAMAFNNILVRGVVQATLNIPVIPGKGINMVDIGWAFSRDFANLFFLVILVFIGLATILRLPSYQMKKALPLLLIMAVLVNFSGVLVGFIVDISNIVTNFFFSRVGTWADSKIFWEFTLAMAKQVLNLVRLDNDPRGYLLTMLTPATTAAVTAAFFLLTAAVFLYALILFIVRISALWTISILSPFAFLAYILPSTRPWFGKWLKELISWSFFGIPLAFFLYLSTYALRHASDITRFYSEGSLASFIPLIDSQTPQELLERSIQEVIAPTIALIFLFIGIRLSKQMAPEGAKATISFINSLPKKILATRMGQLMQSKALLAGQRALAGASGRMGTFTTNLMARGTMGKIAGYAIRPFSGAVDMANRLAGPKMIEMAAANEKIKAPQGFESWTVQNQEAWVTARNLSTRDRLQLAAIMADKDTLTAASREFQNTAVEDATRAIHNEDVRNKKEAKSIVDRLPQRFNAETYLHLAVMGRAGDARDRAEEDFENDIRRTHEALNAFLHEDYTLEIAVRLGLITPEELRNSGQDQQLRTALLDRIAPQIQAREAAHNAALQQTMNGLAAQVRHIREYKAGDITKIDDLASFAARAGVVFGNPANLQKIQELGNATLEDVITGNGGLNVATNSPQKVRQMLQNGNPRMIRMLIATPPGRALNWQGREFVVDAMGQPTESPTTFLRGMNIQDVVQDLRAHNPAVLQLLRERIQANQRVEQERQNLQNERRGLRRAQRRGANQQALNALQQNVTLQERQHEEARDNLGEINERIRQAVAALPQEQQEVVEAIHRMEEGAERFL